MKDTSILINNKIDYQKGIELLGDIETYDEMLEDFLDGVQDKLDKLKKYKENNDTENYAIEAHSLKSDSKYFGFNDLAEISLSHEMAGKENNTGYINDNFNDLITELNRIITVITEYINS